MSETAILQRVRVALSKAGVVIFRNQVGALQDKHGRLVRFGLCTGSSDLIGYRSVVITPDMVGKRVATFVAVEVKDAGGRPTKEQSNFLERVHHDGGISILVRSEEEAIDALRKSPAALS